MRRKILIVLLALGTVGGFGAGFASLHHRHRCHAAHGHSHAAGWHRQASVAHEGAARDRCDRAAEAPSEAPTR